MSSVTSPPRGVQHLETFRAGFGTFRLLLLRPGSVQKLEGLIQIYMLFRASFT